MNMKHPYPGCCSGRPGPNPLTEPQHTAALCDEKSVKRSHHVLSNHTMSENTFLWKTVMIYIMSFK